LPSTIAGIRAALADAMDKHYSPRGWNISPYLSPKPEPPWLDIAVGPIEYDAAMMRGDDAIHIVIRALTQWGDGDVGQALLDDIIDLQGSDGLKKVLEADKTLGGACDAIHVQSVSEPKIYSAGGSDLPGVDFAVEVYPSG
jgi:hypothetical protein